MARKQGFSNRPSTFIGTGENRKELVKRNAQDNKEYLGTCVNTAWNGPDSKRKSPRKYREMKPEEFAKYREMVLKYQGE